MTIVDHPPLVMWMLGASDHLTALPVELRVRLWAIAASAAVSVGCVVLARQRGAKESGCVAAACLSTFTLLPMAGGFVTTPDGPALLGVVACLLWIPLAANRPFRGFGGALAAAAGSLAKVIVPPLAALIAFTAPQVTIARRIAFTAVVALTLPWLWPSLRFQIHHTFVHEPTAAWSVTGVLSALAAALFAQILLWSPWVLVCGARFARGFPLADRLIVVGLSSAMALSAILRAIPPEPNWWAPAAIVVLVAASCSVDELAPRRRLAMLLLAALPTALAAAHTLHPFLPLSREADPTARLHDWRAGTEPPIHAPGVGPYGVAAESCIYQGSCGRHRQLLLGLEPQGQRPRDSPRTALNSHPARRRKPSIQENMDKKKSMVRN